MTKLLVICGATATGKTDLALKIAKKFEGEIVSADSRQVYKYMDIGTGKDIDSNFEFIRSHVHINEDTVGYYSDGEIKIWGYDLVNPDTDFNVSAYIEFATSAISDITSRGKLPILVGGTGLYIHAVLKGIDTSTIPPNKTLRGELSKKNVQALYDLYNSLRPSEAKAMNNSDKHNPRRLLRKIEIAEHEDSFGKATQKNSSLEYDSHVIGLYANQEILTKRITQRVEKRASMDFSIEVQSLIEKGYQNKVTKTIGYKEWQEYLSDEVDMDEALKNWIVAEKKYAKRQMTWFRKQSEIKWFDISKNDYSERVEVEVEKWYPQR